MYKYIIASLLLIACESNIEKQQRAVSDSLHKEDSILARYVMNHLTIQVKDTLVADSIKKKDTLKGTFVLPTLSKDLRNKKPVPIAKKDTCVE